jgi:hypothetical protein
MCILPLSKKLSLGATPGHVVVHVPALRRLVHQVSLCDLLGPAWQNWRCRSFPRMEVSCARRAGSPPGRIFNQLRHVRQQHVRPLGEDVWQFGPHALKSVAHRDPSFKQECAMASGSGTRSSIGLRSRYDPAKHPSPPQRDDRKFERRCHLLVVNVTPRKLCLGNLFFFTRKDLPDSRCWHVSCDFAVAVAGGARCERIGRGSAVRARDIGALPDRERTKDKTWSIAQDAEPKG